ncbi:hypothetical protein QBC36DRAFT_313898 [Triangularia setosa]|uniref:Chitin-binding type-1 domain-containing protein n=1 Tax=Triangularia setosa TaxID=2587417 RepID=A0AAN6W0X7_9PEZI|nr:hypothetical protein QBC36DRAFT_313898 [Podospora setosa]
MSCVTGKRAGWSRRLPAGAGEFVAHYGPRLQEKTALNKFITKRASWTTLLGPLTANLDSVLSQSLGDLPAWRIGLLTEDGSCGPNSLDNSACTPTWGACCGADGRCGFRDACRDGCQQSYSNCNIPWTGVPSPDCPCGCPNLYTALTPALVPAAPPLTGCQSLAGICTEFKVSTDGSCGCTNGDKTCAGSGFGNCGGTTDHCGVGCQAGFGTCSSRSGSISMDGKCGSHGKTCVSSVYGNCCSATGNCGGTADHCGQGCQKSFSNACPTSNIPSADGSCGPSKGGWTSNGDDLNNQCCSASDYCGTTTAHCSKGCQRGYGRCN